MSGTFPSFRGSFLRSANVKTKLLQANTSYVVGVFCLRQKRYLISVGMRFFRAERGKTAYKGWKIPCCRRQKPLQMRSPRNSCHYRNYAVLVILSDFNRYLNLGHKLCWIAVDLIM